MKRFTLALLSTLALAAPSFGWVGGPFSNNVFTGSNGNGTYQGVITGKNVSGIMLFGTAGTSDVANGSYSQLSGLYGNGGRALIFTPNGSVLCNVLSTVDLQARRLTSMVNGSADMGTTDTKNGFTLRGAMLVSSILDSKFTRLFPQVEFSGKGEMEIAYATRMVSSGSNNASVVWDSYRSQARVSGVRTSILSPYVSGNLTNYYPTITAPAASATPKP